MVQSPGIRFEHGKVEIKNTLESEAFKDAPDKPVVFFSAHGVPTSYVSEGGDPYKDEMEECVKLITNELKKIGCEGYKHVLAIEGRPGGVVETVHGRHDQSVGG